MFEAGDSSEATCPRCDRPRTHPNPMEDRERYPGEFPNFCAGRLCVCKSCRNVWSWQFKHVTPAVCTSKCEKDPAFKAQFFGVVSCWEEKSNEKFREGRGANASLGDLPEELHVHAQADLEETTGLEAKLELGIMRHVLINARKIGTSIFPPDRRWKNRLYARRGERLEPLQLRGRLRLSAPACEDVFSRRHKSVVQIFESLIKRRCAFLKAFIKP